MAKGSRPKSNRPRRSRRARNQELTVSRTDFLGSVVPGNGGFVTATLFVYPQETTVSAIARSYAEYKYTKFIVKLVPRGSSTTLGTGFAGFQLSPPYVPTDLAHAAALQGFKVGSSFGVRPTIARLDVGGAARRWFRVVQGDLSGEQAIDPDIVQAWLTTGLQGVQSGVTAFDIHVDYTIRLRGPVSPSGVVTAAQPGQGSFTVQMPTIEGQRQRFLTPFAGMLATSQSASGSTQPALAAYSP